MKHMNLNMSSFFRFHRKHNVVNPKFNRNEPSSSLVDVPSDVVNCWPTPHESDNFPSNDHQVNDDGYVYIYDADLADVFDECPTNSVNSKKFVAVDSCDDLIL